MADPIDHKGERMYKKVLGKAVDADQAGPLIGLRVFTVNHLFANVWGRCEDVGQAVSLRERRLVTIALLAAQGHTEQLRDHVRGASRAGLSEEELLELMIHVAHYAGWAAGTSGQKEIIKVFEDERRDRPTGQVRSDEGAGH